MNKEQPTTTTESPAISAAAKDKINLIINGIKILAVVAVIAFSIKKLIKRFER